MLTVIRYSVLCCLLCGISASLFGFDERVIPRIDHRDNSRQWQEKNAHLIPRGEEIDALLELDIDQDGLASRVDYDMDGDGIENDEDADMDGDGVENRMDPSPYDWRETGYNPFGVLVFLNWDHTWNGNMHNGRRLKRAVDMLKKLGVTCVRVDFTWEDIEPSAGNCEFKKYDTIVNCLAQNNIRMLGVLSYCSPWAGQCWNNPPNDNEDFVKYAGDVIGRYKGKVKYWEVWNEPDSRTYWKNQDRMVRYTSLLKDTYIKAKEIDPSCVILLGGLTENSHIPLKQVYRQGGKDYFDIVNIHPFVDPLREKPMQTMRGKINAVKRVMEECEDGRKRIWITELGAPGVKKTGKKFGWWHGVSPNERQQAQWVESVYTDGVEIERIDKIFWAFFQDTPATFGNGVDFFGLIRENFTVKPSFNSYKKIIDSWTPPR